MLDLWIGGIIQGALSRAGDEFGQISLVRANLAIARHEGIRLLVSLGVMEVDRIPLSNSSICFDQISFFKERFD